jgi:DNA-binding transcriptional MerR regulator
MIKMVQQQPPSPPLPIPTRDDLSQNPRLLPTYKSVIPKNKKFLLTKNFFMLYLVRLKDRLQGSLITMTRMPREGYLRSEVTEVLSREGYDISAEQLRKYEAYGLFSPVKMDNKYRLYTQDVLERIRRVCWLKIIGLPLRRIKEFLELEDQLLESSLLIKKEIGINRDTGEKQYIKELPPLEVIKESRGVEYRRFFNDAQKYISMCDEINERLGKTANILGQAGEDNLQRKDTVNKIYKSAG